MRKLYRIISLVLVFIMMFTMITACKKDVEIPKEKKTLNAPTNVKITESGLITWDEVENATSYTVNIGSKSFDTTETRYQVTDISYDFRFSVVAKAEGYNDSQASDIGTFVAKREPPIDQDPKITIAIKGSSEIRSGHSLTLSANVTGTEDKAVFWEIVEGDDIATIDPLTGVLTANSGIDGGSIIRVSAKSLADENYKGEKVITVVSKPSLTQEMLDILAGQQALGFDGFINISVYNYGLYDDLEMTSVTNIKTSMNGKDWYAEYIDGNTGILSRLYYKKHNDLACQVGVSFMNEEEYAPMLSEDGLEMSWTEAGLYNNFVGLKVEDFAFNEETWRYEYVGNDKNLMKRMTAAANPYDFIPKGLALIIEDGMIMGIYAISEDDFTIAAGYRTVQEMTVAVNYGSTVEVPSISKFEHIDKHDILNKAIENMRNLNSYTLDYTEITGTVYTVGYNTSGFVETITKDECYFDPFTVSYDVSGEEIRNFTGDVYGYHKVNDELYNAYYLNEDVFVPSRAYKKDFEAAKPTFAFAGEIFTSYYEDEEDGSITFYVNEVMSSVASTLYYGVGNDIQLYGLFATKGYTSQDESFTPYVTVKDGYITEACFYFYLGMIYGVVEIEYSDFNEAAIPEDIELDIPVRYVPDSWDELTINVNGDMSESGEDEEVNALEYLTKYMGSREAAERIPFFGNVLGDTYGFGLTTIHMAGGSNSAKQAIVFYYDVPLDYDYTIDSSLKILDDYLLSLGFDKNKYDEYSNGEIVIAPVDSSLDLTVYIWKQ